MDIFGYLDTAQKRQGWTTRAAVAVALGSHRAIIKNWENGRVPEWPNMKKLARLAGVDERRALLDWAVWKSQGAAKSTVDQLLKSMPMLALAIGLVLLPASQNTANAAAYTSKAATYQAPSLYIMYLIQPYKLARSTKPFRYIPARRRCYRVAW